MTMIFNSILELIGNTPIIRIASSEENGTTVYAKVEYFNPAGSVKDRVALAMVEDAERRGILNPGATIIEPTSGNTGVGLALVCAVKGYRLIIVMPDTMSIERRTLVAAYGAEVVLTPGAGGMKGAIDKAEGLKSSIPGAVILQQFDNPANPRKHYATTAEEIIRDTEGRIDVLVAGVGTGGTISGSGRRLKEFNPDIKIVAVEPLSSPVLSGGEPGAHKIQGIGAGFIPGNYDRSIVDEIIAVSNEDAFSAARDLAQKKGLLAGISSGAAAHAALSLASDPAYKGKVIVVILPDTGERYLSTPLFQQ